MTSFHFDIDPKEHFVARAISRARDALRLAFLEEKATRDFTQADLARTLGIDRSVINRQLTGDANMTIRSLAELAWGLDRDLVVQMPRPTDGIGANEHSTRPAIVATKTSSGTAASAAMVAAVISKVSASTAG